MKNAGYGIKLEEEDKEKYNKEVALFNSRLLDYNKEKKNITQKETSEILEKTAFVDLLNDLSGKWKKATHVQKHFLCEFLFLNITIKDGKVHDINLKEDIKELFDTKFCTGGTRERLSILKV